MNRAYSVLTIKSVSADQRRITGIATTPTVDRMGDIVEPLGVKAAGELPLLWQHNADKPVGRVRFGKATKSGIPFEADIAKVDEPGTLKDRVDEAWQSVKSRLVTGVSIGFRVVNDAVERMKDGGLRFLETEVMELSLVTIPANADATILTIKSLDVGKSAPGRSMPSRSPGAAGTNQPPPGGFFSSQAKGNVMSFQQALAALKEARQTKAARMAELADLKRSESRQFNDAERSEFDGLKVEIADLDDDIAVKAVNVQNDAKTAKPVAPMAFVRKQDPDDKFKGQSETRKIIAKAMAVAALKQGNPVRPSDIAEARWGKTNPMLVQVMKANEVAGGGSGSGEAWAELVSADNRYTGDFIEYLYSKTVYDRLPLREVPANVSIKGMDGAFTGYWTGQSKAIKMSQGSGSTISLTPLKVAALTVLSNELLRDSSPSAEMIVRDGLEEALRQAIDSLFLSATAIDNGVAPAGILNNISAKTSDGDDIQSVYTDWKALMGDFITAKNTEGLYVVTTPTLATSLGLMRNALGMPEFQGIDTNGGTFQGRPVLTGDNVGSGDFILLKPSEIWRIADQGVQVSVSQEATIEQSSAPVGATDTPLAMTEYMTSMFQEESTAIKVVRSVNFLRRRSSAVAFVGDATYGATTSV
jgi:HK97 family phage major capsid protein/HK97 family phage prohead protease